MALPSIFESSSGEQRWITQITKILEDEVKIEIDHPVSIFRVPSKLSVFKPEAFVPQVTGLGPYHHFQSQLYEMERYKLAAASRLQQQFKSFEFKQLVNGLKELEQRVRACYHKYLDIEGETLAWIMAIDGIFLLEFLRCHNSISSIATSHLVDSTGKKLAHESVLGDILMLENQIPIFVLSKILSTQSSLDPDVSEIKPKREEPRSLTAYPYAALYLDFCRALSPLKTHENLSESEVCEHAHLLDLLYHLIVPKLEGLPEGCKIYRESEAASFEKIPSLDTSKSRQVFNKLWSMLSSLNVGFITKITTLIKNIIGVSGKIITSIPGASTLASKTKEEIKPENEVSGEEETKTPSVDEIRIPSVSHLSFAGVEFCPTTGGITTIKFDQNTKKFYLPVLTLNVNSEVVMRNLVAYEASIESESLVFARYTELMNGIIDTEEDAKLLRKKKIIVNSPKSDAEVAEIFNGMSKSVRLTSVPFIDKSIKDVNKYFNNTGAVRVYRRMKNFVYGSWQILTFVAVVLLMLLMVVQSFCSVYSCPKLFNTLSSE